MSRMGAHRAVARLLVAVLSAAALALSVDWDYLIWIPRDSTADPLYRFIKNGKAGYIDQAGRVVVPPVLPCREGNGGGEFHDGLLEIAISDGIYVNTKGEKVIDKGFFRGWDFSEGLAVAMPKEGDMWGYIDTKGEFAISPRFASSKTDYVWPFQNGFAKIEVAGRFGYIDHTGNFVIQPRFLDADAFHDGMARVVVDGPCTYIQPLGIDPPEDSHVVPWDAVSKGSLGLCKYTFTDVSGTLTSGARYDYALPFAEGLAPVKLGKLWGFIDRKGTMVIAPKFESAHSFSDGLALVSEKGLFGYIDRRGAYVIRPSFKHAESFADGRAVVGDIQSGYWYIDHAGNQVIPGKFALASPFFKGVAHVKLLSKTSATENIYIGKYAYIDRSGRRIFTYKR
jgi:hypothetical protein